MDNLEHLFGNVRQALPWIDFNEHPVIAIAMLFIIPLVMSKVAQSLMAQLHTSGEHPNKRRR